MVLCAGHDVFFGKPGGWRGVFVNVNTGVVVVFGIYQYRLHKLKKAASSRPRVAVCAFVCAQILPHTVEPHMAALLRICCAG
jgi:hypothetical protein